MVTSRSRPQHTAQIFSPFAGQNRLGGRFSQIGQVIRSPVKSGHKKKLMQQTRLAGERQASTPPGLFQEDLRFDGHPQTEVVVVVLSGLEHDLYGHALDDFHVVARGVFRREQA